jgi:hypothetical protein
LNYKANLAERIKKNPGDHTTIGIFII